MKMPNNDMQYKCATQGTLSRITEVRTIKKKNDDKQKNKMTNNSINQILENQILVMEALLRTTQYPGIKEDMQRAIKQTQKLLSTGKEVEKEGDQQNKISKAIEWCDERIKFYDNETNKDYSGKLSMWYSGKADQANDCKLFLQSLK